MDNFKARMYIAGGIDPFYGEIHQTCVMLNVLIKKFPKSCQTAQLLDETASCLMKVLETFMFIKNKMNIYDLDPDNLYDIVLRDFGIGYLRART